LLGKKKKKKKKKNAFFMLQVNKLTRNRLADRQSASAIIEKFNGHSISGSSAPLQVRFADSPAQKRLKSQTSSTKKVPIKNHRDNTTIFPFPIRPMMPVTPETMLGIAPSSSNG
jgi:hypothetical protein